MRRGQRREDAARRVKRRGVAQPLATAIKLCAQLVQRQAVHVLEHDPDTALVLDKIVELDDRRMRHACICGGFAQHGGARTRVPTELRQEQLDDHQPLEPERPFLTCEKDLARRALRQSPHETVAPHPGRQVAL